jgi:DNA-binding MarR family transcriptional regulator
MKPIHRHILAAIQSNLCINVSQLAKTVKRSISTTSYHAHRLQDGGYLVIETDGCNNFFRLTDRGIGYLRTLPENLETFDRAHDILFKFPIRRPPKQGFPKEGFVINESLRGVSEQLTKGYPNGTIIQITDPVITVCIMEVRGASPEQCLMAAYSIAEREIISLIRKNPGLVVGRSTGRLASRK